MVKKLVQRIFEIRFGMICLTIMNCYSVRAGIHGLPGPRTARSTDYPVHGSFGLGPHGLGPRHLTSIWWISGMLPSVISGNKIQNSYFRLKLDTFQIFKYWERHPVSFLETKSRAFYLNKFYVDFVSRNDAGWRSQKILKIKFMSRCSWKYPGFCFQKWRCVTFPKSKILILSGFCFQRWRWVTFPGFGFCFQDSRIRVKGTLRCCDFRKKWKIETNFQFR